MRTLIDVAPSITWLLVRMSPFDERIMPVPAALEDEYDDCVVISTTPPSTLAAIFAAAEVDGALAGSVVGVVGVTVEPEFPPGKKLPNPPEELPLRGKVRPMAEGVDVLPA